MEIDVKQILLKPIQSKYANAFIIKNHYSGKKVNNSILHFGCFYNNILHGVLSFGPPLDKRKVLGLVTNTKWNEMFELNRMAFDATLPKNSESRCISIAIRLIKKHYQHIKWILSFADGIQCGDGTIYRASGFCLTGINNKGQLLKMKSGEVRHRIALHTNPKIVSAMGGKMASMSKMAQTFDAELMTGFQFRYIYLIDRSQKITVPIIPFSKINELGAGMYKGVKRNIRGSSVTGSTSAFQAERNVRINSAAL